MRPKVCPNPRMISNGIAAPPEIQVPSEDVSAVAWARSYSIGGYMVGTPRKIVTVRRPMISTALPASNRGSRVGAPPTMTAFRPAVSPKTRNSGRAAHGHVVRVGVEHLGGREAGVAGQLRVREPLGLPVVPEVYKITASSSPASATESAGAIRRQRAQIGCVDLDGPHAGADEAPGTTTPASARCAGTRGRAGVEGTLACIRDAEAGPSGRG